MLYLCLHSWYMVDTSRQIYLRISSFGYYLHFESGLSFFATHNWGLILDMLKTLDPNSWMFCLFCLLIFGLINPGAQLFIDLPVYMSLCFCFRRSRAVTQVDTCFVTQSGATEDIPESCLGEYWFSFGFCGSFSFPWAGKKPIWNSLWVLFLFSQEHHSVPFLFCLYFLSFVQVCLWFLRWDRHRAHHLAKSWTIWRTTVELQNIQVWLFVP